jgi:S-adenosylmethionine synthetase
MDQGAGEALARDPGARDGVPVRALLVVVSQQHRAGCERGLREAVEEVVRRVVPEELFRKKPGVEIVVNPSGSFVSGGPSADTGLTGRKLAVDAYGPRVPHGGRAFSGKDPSKLDRSGAYAARWLAKNVVAAGIARRCLVEIAYVIGRAEPVCVEVNTFGTAACPDEAIADELVRLANPAPGAIVERLGLRKPIYARTSAYGHFGREPEADGGFSWERTEIAEALRGRLG